MNKKLHLISNLPYIVKAAKFGIKSTLYSNNQRSNICPCLLEAR